MDAFQWLRLGSGLGIALLVLAIASEAWLDYRSPESPDPAAGKTVEIRMKGGARAYLTPMEYYLNRGAYAVGGALVAGSILGMWWMTRRRSNK
jgi:hypothetical protein